jgi:hypothetical protein
MGAKSSKKGNKNDHTNRKESASSPRKGKSPRKTPQKKTPRKSPRKEKKKVEAPDSPREEDEADDIIEAFINAAQQEGDGSDAKEVSSESTANEQLNDEEYAVNAVDDLKTEIKGMIGQLVSLMLRLVHLRLFRV